MATRTARLADGDDTLLRVQLLGGFRVSVGARVVPEAAWRQRRAAAVVKLLALEPTYRLRREQLMDLLWPELDYDAQLNNLRQALHHARRQLELAGMDHGAALRRDGDAVVLADGDAVWVDAHAFERAVRQAWQSLTPERAQAALALYTGDLLPDDPYEGWTEPRRTTLRASYLALLSRLGQLHRERGERGQAIDAYQRLALAEPADEAARVALMRLHASSGQPELALAQFNQLAAHLATELDDEPEPATRALAREIAGGRYPEAAAESMAPASTAARARPSLPTPVSALIGRERELAEARQLLTTERLVTLTGPGGIGKTRLAIEVARAMTDAFPDGIAFIDLASVTEPDRVATAIAQSLDVREVHGQPLVATLAAATRDRRMLLLLDNFEQVVAAAPLVATLLEQAPTLKALVTSRVRLRLRGEREQAVPPLGVAADDPLRSDAVSLFVARAREVRPAFEATAGNLATIAAICRRLDGLPLAIELAAAWGKVVSPEAILDRLARPLALLSAGPNDLPERQQTIRATIEWSLDLQAPARQALFARLSVFVGGWTLEAAEEVASSPDLPIDTLDGLASLVDASLVSQRQQPDGEIRFGMLATIREFGLERLDARGEGPALRDRHAVWVGRLVAEAAPHLEGAEQAGWLARLAREDDNIRAALVWLRERGHAEAALRLIAPLRLHWFARGRIREGYEQTMAVADLPESIAHPTQRADALMSASFLARAAGDFQGAYDVTRASLAISHEIHDRHRAADGLVNLGHIALQRGQLDDARALLQRSLTNYRELSNQQGIADTLGFLAQTDLQSGDLETAEQRLNQCVAIWDGLADLQGSAWARAQLGLVQLEQRAFLAAWHNLMGSLAILDRLDFRGDIYTVFDGLARLAVIYGQTELAAQLAAAAASVREESGIRLSSVEQAGVDRLHAELLALLGSAGLDELWSRRAGWTVSTITRRAQTTLAPLLTTSVSEDLPAISAAGAELTPVRRSRSSD